MQNGGAGERKKERATDGGNGVGEKEEDVAKEGGEEKKLCGEEGGKSFSSFSFRVLWGVKKAPPPSPPLFSWAL